MVSAKTGRVFALPVTTGNTALWKDVQLGVRDMGSVESILWRSGNAGATTVGTGRIAVFSWNKTAMTTGTMIKVRHVKHF